MSSFSIFPGEFADHHAGTAGALDTLLKPDLPVLIPDCAHRAVTRLDLPVTSDFVEWMEPNVDQVHLRATQELL